MIEQLERRQLLSGEIRIDAGGSGYTDLAGKVWQADTYFHGGQAKSWAFNIDGTGDPKLFTTRREGAGFHYVIPVDDGNYFVTVDEAEPYFKDSEQRIFNVYAQGKLQIEGWDLAGTVGYGEATKKTFPISVTNGQLDLHFVGMFDDAMVSAIDIAPSTLQAGILPKPQQFAASWTAKGNILLNWDNTDPDQKFALQRSIDGGKFVTARSLLGGNSTYADSELGPSYRYRLRAIGPGGNSLPATAVVAGTEPQQTSSFSRKPISLPATIQFENFDNGGLGKAYGEKDISDTGESASAPWSGDYRSTAVDLQPVWSSPGDYEICDAYANEWTNYTVQIPSAGKYQITTHFSAPSKHATIHYELDGSPVTRAIKLSLTKAFNDYATLTTPTVALPAGRHVLTLWMDTNGDNGKAGDFDWFRVEPAGSAAGSTAGSTKAASHKSAAAALPSSLAESIQSLFTSSSDQDERGIDQLL